MNPNEWTNNKNIERAVLFFLVVSSIFVLTKTVHQVFTLHTTSEKTEHTITTDGMGEVSAVPDAASFNYTVSEQAKTVALAQTKATEKTNAVIAFLKQNGIAEKDIKTENYSINPNYSYQNTPCVAGTYCPGGKQVIDGYEVSQSVTVKVRDTGKAGEILTGVGAKGATNISGLSFTIDIDRESELQDQARDKAIALAREKAEKIAGALGVHLGPVVSFTENSGGRPMPFYAMKADIAVSEGAPTPPVIPSGENKITSAVSVQFEIW